jgi:dihydroorotase-like cyclic amidohydrolase
MSLTIKNIRLAYPASHPSSGKTFRVKCEDGRVVKIEKDTSTGSERSQQEQVPPVDGSGGLLLPSYVS